MRFTLSLYLRPSSVLEDDPLSFGMPSVCILEELTFLESGCPLRAYRPVATNRAFAEFFFFAIGSGGLRIGPPPPPPPANREDSSGKALSWLGVRVGAGLLRVSTSDF